MFGDDVKPGLQVLETMDELVDAMDKYGKRRWLVNHLAHQMGEDARRHAAKIVDPDAETSMPGPQSETEIPVSTLELDADPIASTKSAESGGDHARIRGSP